MPVSLPVMLLVIHFLLSQEFYLKSWGKWMYQRILISYHQLSSSSDRSIFSEEKVVPGLVIVFSIVYFAIAFMYYSAMSFCLYVPYLLLSCFSLCLCLIIFCPCLCTFVFLPCFASLFLFFVYFVYVVLLDPSCWAELDQYRDQNK